MMSCSSHNQLNPAVFGHLVPDSFLLNDHFDKNSSQEERASVSVKLPNGASLQQQQKHGLITLH